jgi:hypothetical protein
MSIQVTMKFLTTTPGALRYQETDGHGENLSIKNGAKIGTLYIRKSALDGEQPETIRVTIE